VFKHQGFGLVGEDSWLAAIDAKAVVLKQACHGDGREPAQMGAIQEPAVPKDPALRLEQGSHSGMSINCSTSPTSTC